MLHIHTAHFTLHKVSRGRQLESQSVELPAASCELLRATQDPGPAGHPI